MTQTIYGSKAAYRVRQWIENGGVFDTVVMGNSRVAFGGRGILWGAASALAKILPQYSTGMVPFGGHDQTTGAFSSSYTWSNPYGWYGPAWSTSANRFGNVANVGNAFGAAATEAWAKRMSTGQNVTGTTYYYNGDAAFYYLAGSAVNTGAENGPFVPSVPLYTNSLDADNALRAIFHFCSEVPGGSSFEPGIDSYNGSAFSNAATCGVQTIAAAATVAGDIMTATCTLAAASRGGATAGVCAAWTPRVAGRAFPTGPLLLGSCRLASTTQTNGWAVHRGLNLGGNGTRDLANQFRTGRTTPTAGTRSTYGFFESGWEYCFKVWTAEQLLRNQRPRLRVIFNEVQNSRNTAATSMGGITDGDSADALIDNTSYTIADMLGAWCRFTATMANGTQVHFGEDDIAIEVHTEHVQADPNEAELETFGDALCSAIPARFPRCAFVVDDRELITYAELNSATTPLFANAPSEGGADDVAHLKQAGEELMQTRTLRAIRAVNNPDVAQRPRIRSAARGRDLAAT